MISVYLLLDFYSVSCKGITILATLVADAQDADKGKHLDCSRYETKNHDFVGLGNALGVDSLFERLP